MLNIKNVTAYGTNAKHEVLKKMMIPRRQLRETDVDLEILYCGICHSDLHQIHDDFGHTMWPVVPGHEIVVYLYVLYGVGNPDKKKATVQVLFH